MAKDVRRRGYFSVLKWRSNPTRDEAKNIGVILVDPEGEYGGILTAPPSFLSKRLRDQGIIDSLLEGFRERFNQPEPPNLEELENLSTDFVNTLVLTAPKKVLVTDKDATLTALYNAFVRKSTGFPRRKMTKGALRDSVTNTLRKRGYKVRLGEYIENFIFDAVILDPKSMSKTVTEILSFANDKKSWTPEEHDAGHFLYAIRKIDHAPLAIVQPPTEISLDVAIESHERILSWLNTERVEVIDPDAVTNGRFPDVQT